MYYFATFALFCVAVAACLPDPPHFDSNGDNCCSLAWELVIDSGDQRFIPSTAIPFGKTPFSSTTYFARKAEVGAPQVGAIDDRIEEPVYIWPFENANLTVQGWTNTYVLANPNNCDLKWQYSLDQLFNRTAALEFPSIDGYFFARIPGMVVAAPKQGGLANGIRMSPVNPEQGNQTTYDVLTIDCASSLRKTLAAELFDIEFDTKALINESQGLKVLSLTEVINDSDFDQEATIHLESEVSSSLEMLHDVQLYSMMDTKWGAHSSTKARWLDQLIGLSGPVIGGYDAHSVKNNFTQTGAISFDSRRKQIKYNENIVVKARTKSVVTMNTQPIGGSQKFTARYRISSSKANANVTLSQVSNSLRRQGFAGWNTLQLDQSGSIVFTVQGHMQVDAGVDTHILIDSYPLANSSQFRHTSRLVRGLDPLSLPP